MSYVKRVLSGELKGERDMTYIILFEDYLVSAQLPSLPGISASLREKNNLVASILTVDSL